MQSETKEVERRQTKMQVEPLRREESGGGWVGYSWNCDAVLGKFSKSSGEPSGHSHRSGESQVSQEQPL